MTSYEQALHNAQALQTAAFILLGVLSIDSIVRLCMLWNNLNHERGSDRICWFLVLQIPLFGTAAYVFIALPQREANDDGNGGGRPSPNNPRAPSPESLAWAKETLARR